MREGKELYDNSIVRMKRGGFNLRKWKTKDPLLAVEFKDIADEIGPSSVRLVIILMQKRCLGESVHIQKIRYLVQLVIWLHINLNLT